MSLHLPRDFDTMNPPLSVCGRAFVAMGKKEDQEKLAAERAAREAQRKAEQERRQADKDRRGVTPNEARPRKGTNPHGDGKGSRGTRGY